MTPRIGSPLPVLSPGRVLVPADPHRRLECFLVDVFPTGFDLHTQFPLPVDELVAAEVEDHLVLADIKKCQLRSGKFEIELQRLYAVPLSRFDDHPTADPETKLRVILDEFLREQEAAASVADSAENRSLIERARTALARVSSTTVTAVRAVPRFDGGANAPPRLALVRELSVSPPSPMEPLNGSVSVPELNLAPEALVAPETTASPEEPETDPTAELPAIVEAAEVEVATQLAAIHAEPSQIAAEPEPVGESRPMHWTFCYATNGTEHPAQPVTPTAGWLYHFVPAPLAPLTPALRDLAKETIERL